MRWKANVTVAAVIEKDGKFLMIEEQADDARVINQPAGHLEEHESLMEAVIREVREETAWDFEASHIVGVYLFPSSKNGITYLRICYAGSALKHYPEQKLDEGIIQALWMSQGEIASRSGELRSPLVMQCIDDYLSGKSYPLELIQHFRG